MPDAIGAPPKVTPLFRFALKVQVFMLRRRMIKAMNGVLMVITTTGRRSGKPYSIPIGYLQDGRDYIALSRGGHSNWYKNVLQQPEVTLNIQGRDLRARGEPVSDPGEIAQLFEQYKIGRAGSFARFFGVPLDSPEELLLKARDANRYVRFRPLSQA